MSNFYLTDDQKIQIDLYAASVKTMPREEAQAALVPLYTIMQIREAQFKNQIKSI